VARNWDARTENRLDIDRIQGQWSGMVTFYEMAFVTLSCVCHTK